MSPEDLRELDELAKEQLRLRNAMASLEDRLVTLRMRVENPAATAAIPAALAAREHSPPPLPPLPEPIPKSAAPALILEPASSAAPIPPSELNPTLVAAAPAVDQEESHDLHSPPPLPPAKAPISPAPVAPAVSDLPKAAEVPAPIEPPHRESLELQIGTVWLARAGILILITGFVFLGNYAWHSFVHWLGAGGKIALMALGGFALAGLGSWLERRREEMRNYANVLMAGGAAAIYYTAYAAHFVEPLRIIESPLAAGILLLALGGGFAWYAHRKESQTFAIVTLLLAYYTAAINEIGNFTLFSNLVITGTAIFFLARHRWAAVSWVALIGTYVSFGWWRAAKVGLPAPASAGAHAGWTGAPSLAMSAALLTIVFLAGYWLLFTGGAFFATDDALPSRRRASFVSLNNGAFFFFAADALVSAKPGAFWWFSLSFGIVLLALAALAAKRRTADFVLDGSYLAQGLALVTLGLMSKITGQQLALTMAVESALLLTGVRRRHGILFQIAGHFTAFLAFSLALVADSASNPEAGKMPAILTETAVAALLFFDAWWIKVRRETLSAGRFEFRSAAFSVPALMLVGDLFRVTCPEVWLPTACALAAVVCTASIYVLRLPEIALPGQFFLAIGLVIWTTQNPPGAALHSWWSPLPLIATALGLSHWWQWQKELRLDRKGQAALEMIFAGAFVLLGMLWMYAFCDAGQLLLAAALAGMGTLVYGLATRSWAVALLGQAFAAVSCFAFLVRLGMRTPPSWGAGLAPIAGLAAVALILTSAPAGKSMVALAPDAPVAAIANLYRFTAWVLFAVWGCEYVPAPWRGIFFGAVGAGLVVAGQMTRVRERTMLGLCYAAAAFVLFWVHSVADSEAGWGDLAAIFLVPASLRYARRLARGQEGASCFVPEPAHVFFTGAAVASLWFWVTQMTIQRFDANMLTVSWALLAPVIFAAGLGLRERVYRLGGFVVLAFAIGRVFLVDVWKLETVFRIVSFMVLGVVLLVLGFVYNRYAETIRRWL